ncbi:carbohydrate ABC transporter permease [Rugosimonospora africana]|uniref:Sugar ABC transporter permease n=1 Tax=Rugosimonospora africana TaxID=556532 RepID=A0A8J3QR82_9ACTN|nr:carbohydrate ABC transporter permease [Rugosimonospora africana]GIH15393.1 sugar ABC transporter permease [Rugosimonospora africana]
MSTTPVRGRRRDDDMIPVKLYGLPRGTVTFFTTLATLFAIFTLLPIAWLVINSTKNQANLFESFGFWFAGPFEFFHNFSSLFHNLDGDGVYFQWLGNTAFYAVVGGLGATALSALAGYGFACFDFRGSRALFSLAMAALLVPITAITLPLYLVYAKAGLINSIWGMLLPSVVSPVGVYLMRTYVAASVPRELIDAARIDGAGEVRIFLTIALPLMVPGLMTVLLLAIVGIWNNYFLPLLIFSQNKLYPLTVGLGLWTQRAQNSGDASMFPALVVGGLVTVVPLVGLFLMVQRYWRGGLLLGSIAN